MNTRIISLWITTSLLLLSCGNEGAEQNSGGGEPVAVEMATAGQATSSTYLAVSGKVSATRQANLGTRMMGYVRSVHVKVGDPVKAGTVLLNMDNADLQARMAQASASITEAEAAFTNAEKDYQRYTNLFSEQSASQKELDDITARYRMAGARLEAARQMKKEVEAQFAYARISAPFDGVVTNLFAEPGDLANPGQPLVAVEAPGSFEVEARIPENEIPAIAIGDTVSAYIKSIGKRLGGHVSELSNSARNTGGQYLATISLDEESALLRSGMYATLNFPRKGAADVTGQPVYVPEEAIVHRGQLTGIYTVSQTNTALLRWLRLGQVQDGQVEVLSGLRSGESYIVSAESKLYNGVPVRIR